MCTKREYDYGDKAWFVVQKDGEIDVAEVQVILKYEDGLGIWYNLCPVSFEAMQEMHGICGDSLFSSPKEAAMAAVRLYSRLLASAQSLLRFHEGRSSEKKEK
jgi:hypothetical protein